MTSKSPRFVLSTFGRLDLTSAERGSVKTLLVQPKRVALLVYLLVEPPVGGYVRRDSLLALFWPESDETRARGSLRQALQFLRRSLGDSAIVTRGEDEIAVDPTVVACDVTAFRADLAAGREEEALARYSGDFLPGFLVQDAPQLEDWIAVQRTTLTRQAGRTASGLAERALQTNPATAAQFARRAVELAPLDEHSARVLARALAAEGNRAGALIALGELRARLERELEVTPSAESVALEAQLREGSELTAAAPTRSTAGAPTTSTAPSLSPDSAPNRQRAPGRLRVFAVTGAFTVALVAAIVFSRPSAPPDSRYSGDASARVLVAPFHNQTGDTALRTVGPMVADWLTEGLSRVEGLAVVPLSAVSATTRSLSSAALDDTSQLAATRVARELGASILVRGSVYRTGGTLHLQAHISAVSTGELLRPSETVSVPADSVITGIDLLRTRVVATLAPVGDTVTHLRRAIAPPSYAAYRDYIDGLDAFVSGDLTLALARFERSAATDSGYPMPRIAAAITLVNLGLADSAAASVARLTGVRSSLGPLERATLDMTAGMLTSDLELTERAAREQARIAPGTLGHYMVAEVARRRGRPAEALEVLRVLGPDRGEMRGWRPYWRELTGSLHMLGRHEEELVAAHDAAARYPDVATYHLYVIRALAALGRTAAIDSVLNAPAALSGARAPLEGEYIHVAALGLARRGDSTAGASYRARELAWHEARASAARSPAARIRHARALLLDGSNAAARDTLSAVVAASPTDVMALGLLGIAAARVGDSARVAQIEVQLKAIDSARSSAVRALADHDIEYWLVAIAAQQRSPRAVHRVRATYAAGRSIDPALWTDPWLAPIAATPEFQQLVRPAQ